MSQNSDVKIRIATVMQAYRYNLCSNNAFSSLESVLRDIYGRGNPSSWNVARQRHERGRILQKELRLNKICQIVSGARQAMGTMLKTSGLLCGCS